jgi:hypothetical protein
MKPIWYFVGILLLVLGVIIVVTGAYAWAYPPEHQKVLAGYHPALWWGGIMTIAGLALLLANRKKTVQ